jgi:hypothetical protein
VDYRNYAETRPAFGSTSSSWWIVRASMTVASLMAAQRPVAFGQGQAGALLHPGQGLRYVDPGPRQCAAGEGAQAPIPPGVPGRRRSGSVPARRENPAADRSRIPLFPISRKCIEEGWSAGGPTADHGFLDVSNALGARAADDERDRVALAPTVRCGDRLKSLRH